MKVIRSHPVSLWREELAKCKTLLDAVHEFQLAYSDFRVVAQSLDHMLGQFVRAFNSAQNIDSANDRALLAFIFGRLCGFDANKLTPWLGMPIKEPPPWMVAGHEQALGSQDILSTHGVYMKKRGDLEAKLASLAGKLDA